MFDNSDENNKKGYITLGDLQSILYSAFSMNPQEVEKIFKEINVKNDNKITYGKFERFIRIRF